MQGYNYHCPLTHTEAKAITVKKINVNSILYSISTAQ